MYSAQLLREGKLDASQAALFAEIRKDPSNAEYRVFLFQLFCIQQDWSRAQNQLKVLADLSDIYQPLVQTYSQLIDAETARASVLEGSRQPSCLGKTPEWITDYHQALCISALGDFENAKEAALRGADAANSIAGNVDGESFSWICDSDMRFGPVFEVMTQGSYRLLPFEYIKTITFEPVEDLRDMVWRPANVTLWDGAKLIVFVPTRYPLTIATKDNEKLARTCSWKEPVPEFFIGEGQRILMTESREYGLLDIKCIEFEQGSMYA